MNANKSNEALVLGAGPTLERKTPVKNLATTIRESRVWPICFRLRGYQEKALVLLTDELLKKRGYRLPESFIMIPPNQQPAFKLIEPEKNENFKFNLAETAHLYTKYTEQQIFSIMGTIQFQSKDHPLWKAMMERRILNRIEQNHLIFLRQDGEKILVYKFYLNKLEQLMLYITPVTDESCINIDSIIFSDKDSEIWKKQVFSNKKRNGVFETMFSFLMPNLN